jgi:hypothetical protein
VCLTGKSTEGSFRFWDELYSDKFKNILRTEKQYRFGFLYGFYIMKKINDLFVIYSFATKSQKDRTRFEKSTNTLASIGDYFFNDTKAIHSAYTTNPKVSAPFLKLAIDNSKKSIWSLD